eukprot:216156_1
MGAGKRGGVSGGDAFSICWSTAAISMPLVKDVYTTFALPSKGISFLGDCQRNSGPVPLVLIPSTSLRAEESALAERRVAAEKAREEAATMAAKVHERRAAAALGVRQKLTDGDLKPEESLLLQFLKDLRKTLAEEIQTEAKQNGVPVRDTLIFENSSLIEMAQRRPTNIDTFGDISGVGLTKKDRFGKRFTDEIGKYCKGRLNFPDGSSPPLPTIPSPSPQSGDPTSSSSSSRSSSQVGSQAENASLKRAMPFNSPQPQKIQKSISSFSGFTVPRRSFQTQSPAAPTLNKPAVLDFLASRSVGSLDDICRHFVAPVHKVDAIVTCLREEFAIYEDDSGRFRPM